MFAAIHNRLGPASDAVTRSATGSKICIRFNTIHEAVQEMRHAALSISATTEAVEGNILPPSAHLSKSLLKQIVTPLCHLKFEEELKTHADLTWAKALIIGIGKGVSLGHHGPRCQCISRNLTSAYQTVDNKLSKESELREHCSSMHASGGTVEMPL